MYTVLIKTTLFETIKYTEFDYTLKSIQILMKGCVCSDLKHNTESVYNKGIMHGLTSLLAALHDKHFINKSPCFTNEWPH